MKALTQEIRRASNGTNIVFVSGLFDVLHIGHIRLLEYAKSLGDFLVVGLHPDETQGVHENFENRLKYLEMLSIVNRVVPLDNNLERFLENLKPEIVVKGAEHKDKKNLEQEIVSAYGGRIYFSSGDFTHAPGKYDENEILPYKRFVNKPVGFLARHNIGDGVIELVDRFSELKVAVIGDTIVDEYIDCTAVGMSREDATIVVSPNQSQIFSGGASIVAAHMQKLGANVTFYSILGDDQYFPIVRDKLKEYGVSDSLIRDKGRKTTLKKRYRADGKTLLRVSAFDSHDLAKNHVQEIVDKIEREISRLDIIVFSDFSYGALPRNMVDQLVDLAKRNDVFVAADSQSSSQMGDIAKFKGANLISPTEFEARGAYNERNQSLTVLVDRLYERLDVETILVTMGSEGVFVQSKGDPQASASIRTDQVPALATSVVDVAGGGDVFLATASMAMRLGATIWEASYLGSVAAAIQVRRVGNIPLESSTIKQALLS